MSRDLFDFAQTMPAGKIEACARALYEYQQGCLNGTLSTSGVPLRDMCPPWANIHPENRDHYLRSARAALSAIFPAIERPSVEAFVAKYGPPIGGARSLL